MDTDSRKLKPKLFRSIIGTIRSRSAEDIKFVGKVDLQIRKYTKRNRRDSTGTMSSDKNNNIKFQNVPKIVINGEEKTDRGNNSSPCLADSERFVHFCI